MRIIRSIKDWEEIRWSTAFNGKTLGFVPTMGALHQGHLSLAERSKKENDFTLVSIFVNPTQFNDKSDLMNYPRDFEGDKRKLEYLGVDYLFYPTEDELYPHGHTCKIVESEVSSILCGQSRPGHFAGVLTVVMKLLQIAEADCLYLGEKDYQQYLLIKRMCAEFFIKAEIISCPTIREDDDLAMSSRNLLLNDEQRLVAGHFPRLLKSSKSLEQIRDELDALGLKVDYLEEKWGRRFAAVKIGQVRLIDNVKI